MRFTLKFVRALGITSLLLVHQLLVPAMILAEDASASAETPAATPSPTPSPSATPTPSPTPVSVTQTGNAEADSSSSINANNVSVPVSGGITASDCSVAGDLGCPVSASNSATVKQTASAEAGTGGNSTNNAGGSGAIASGQATASAQTFNALNTVTVTASGSAALPSDASGTLASSISLANQASLTSTTTASGSSGANIASNNGGNGTVISGESTANVSVANLLNTNAVGSTIKFLIINIDADQVGNINLLDVWKKLQMSATPTGSGEVASQSAEGPLTLSIDSAAESKVIAAATAISGQNQADNNNGSGVVTSGNAYAGATVFNLINTNLIGSQFLFAVINIFHSLRGDIVVPNIDHLGSSVASAYAPMSYASTVIHNQAILSGDVVRAEANSGNNIQLNNPGIEAIQTGPAYSQATSTNILNATITGSNWYQILLNNFGMWDGSVTGLNNPDAMGTIDAHTSNTLVPSVTTPPTATSMSSLDPSPAASKASTLTAFASTAVSISAAAISGKNETSNNRNGAQIATGTSVALANLFQMINTNVLGSNFFFPIINIFNRWTGNLAIAYPDLHIGMVGSTAETSPGQTVEYTVTYTNKGYEDASRGSVAVELPTDVSYLGNSLNLTPSVSGTRYDFPVGIVKSGAGGSFTIQVKVNVPSAEAQPTSLLSKVMDLIVPHAFADGNEREFTVTAAVETSEPQPSTGDKSVSVTTRVVLPVSTPSKTSSSAAGEPVLSLRSTNNVNDFVHSGDTVTFQAWVTNTGNAVAKSTRLQQLIRTTSGERVVIVTIPVKDIYPGITKHLSFGLKLPTALASGEYYSSMSIQAISADTGNPVTSNPSETNFKVRNLSPLISQAEAKTPEGPQVGQVLGTATTLNYPKAAAPFDYKPYLLLACLLIFTGIRFLRRQVNLRLPANVVGSGETFPNENPR